MSMTITLEDGATPSLRRYMAELRNRQPMMQAAGKAVERVLKDHFRKRDSEGNKRGFPRKHFWNRIVSKATSYTGATNDEATVTIASREFAQKLYGGTITAGSGKYLAIPLTAKAAAAGRPRLWTGAKLTLIKGPRAAVLVESLHSSLRRGARGKVQGGEAQYLLKKSVKQEADPRALPSETKIASGARMAMADYIGRRLAA